MRLSDLALFVTVLIAAILLARKSPTGFNANRARAVPLYCGVSLLILAAVLFFVARAQVRSAILVERNFYGVLTVRQKNADQPEWRAYELLHGRTSHGFQFLAPEKRDLATSYYGPSSGVGQALVGLREHLQRSADLKSLRIGIVGLGVGTLAAYGKRGDYIRFYEINREVVRIATDPRYFTYLKDCPANLGVILGDARISMENELRRKELQQFDLLAVDAFAGDAIPVHLLTSEAFQVYLSEIKWPSGVLAIHISNAYLDLSPVLIVVAQHFGLSYLLIDTDGDEKAVSASYWVLLSHDQEFLDSLSRSKQSGENEAPRPAIRLWTDDYSNLFQLLRW